MVSSNFQNIDFLLDRDQRYELHLLSQCFDVPQDETLEYKARELAKLGIISSSHNLETGLSQFIQEVRTALADWKVIEELAHEVGIQSEYTHQVKLSAISKLNGLKAMDILPDAHLPEIMPLARNALEQKRTEPFLSMADVQPINKDMPGHDAIRFVTIRDPLDRELREYHWRYTEGTWSPTKGDLPGDKVYSGTIDVCCTTLIDSKKIGGRIHEIRIIKFSDLIGEAYPDIGFNYSTLEIAPNNGAPNERQTATVIHAPSRLPSFMAEGEKAMGVYLSIPTLRSGDDDGIGDLRVLRNLAGVLGERKIDFISILPTCARSVEDPLIICPYAAENRYANDFTLLSLRDIPEFRTSAAAQKLYFGETLQNLRQEAREQDYFLPFETMLIKLSVLNVLYDEFAENGDKTAFADYKKDHAQWLDVFVKDQVDQYYRRNWDQIIADHGLQARPVLAREERTEFFKWLQFNFDQQLQRAQQTCLDAGMKIGILGDNPISVLPFSTEARAMSDYTYKGGVACVPPDMYSAVGQNWGTVVFKDNFKGIARLYARLGDGKAGIRDDHAFKLLRTGILKNGLEYGKDGVFISRDARMNAAIICLEFRHKIYIGEDLGTAPPGMAEWMDRFNMMHYAIVPYKSEEVEGYPAVSKIGGYSPNSLLKMNCHDMPLLNDAWAGILVEERKYNGYYRQAGEKELEKDLNAIGNYRQTLYHFLTTTGAWDRFQSERLDNLREQATPPAYLVEMCVYAMRRQEAMLTGVFLGDLDPSNSGSFNIPGFEGSMVVKKDDKGKDKVEVPLWSKRLPFGVEDLRYNPQLKNISNMIEEETTQPSPARPILTGVRVYRPRDLASVTAFTMAYTERMKRSLSLQ